MRFYSVLNFKKHFFSAVKQRCTLHLLHITWVFLCTQEPCIFPFCHTLFARMYCQWEILVRNGSCAPLLPYPLLLNVVLRQRKENLNFWTCKINMHLTWGIRKTLRCLRAKLQSRVEFFFSFSYFLQFNITFSTYSLHLQTSHLSVFTLLIRSNVL